MLLRWIDVLVFKRMLYGFHPVGTGDYTGLFRSIHPSFPLLDPQELLNGSRQYRAELLNRRPPKDAAARKAMDEAVKKDLENHFADGPFTSGEVDALLGRLSHSFVFSFSSFSFSSFFPPEATVIGFHFGVSSYPSRTA